MIFDITFGSGLNAVGGTKNNLRLHNDIEP